jgi:uncharacterized membrane protein (DUF2068 family)
MADTTNAQQPEVRKRPFGLYAIIVLQILSILAMIYDVFQLQRGVSAQTLPNVENTRWIIMLDAAIAILLVFVIIGLWRYRKWAWFTVMVLAGVSLIFGIWQYFHGGEPYVDLLISVLVVFYLNQRSVQAVFEDEPLRRKPLEAAA